MTARRTPWKRPMDLLLASLLLVLCSPLLLAIAAAVWLDSRGPVLYRQERIGRNGKPFTLLKFRSMTLSPDEGRHRELAEAWFRGDEAVRGYKSMADPRVTRVGRFLRRTSLDELPQLINVLRGEMTLVGPRPAIRYELELYRPDYYRRQLVPPGITGLWQVSGRDRLTAPEMMALDLRYADECSPWLDLKILALTASALFYDWRGSVPAHGSGV